MRRILSLLLVLTFIFVMVGCGTGKGQIIDFSQTNGKKQVLEIWLDDDDGNYMDALKIAFEEEYPDIVVNFYHHATVDARKNLKIYGQSGNGCDIFQFPHDHMAQAILENLVYALPESLKDTLEETILPLALDIATVAYDQDAKEFGTGTEQLYAVPISIESVGLFYNIGLLNQIFGEGNWTVPTTMEELFNQADYYMNDDHNGDGQGGRALLDEQEGTYSSQYYFATGSDTPGWGDQYFDQFIYSAFGWRPFGPEGNDDSAVGFESTDLQDALTWMKTELKPRVTGEGGSVNAVKGQSLFEEGKLPYVIAGPWAMSTFDNAGLNYGIAQIPSINVDGVDQETRTFAGAQMLAIYKDSRNKEAAIKFMEFIATPEAAEILNTQEHDLPALRPELLEEIPAINDDPLLQAVAHQLETSIPMPTIPAVTYYWAPGETMVKNIWNDGKDILAEVQKAEASYRASMDLATS